MTVELTPFEEYMFIDDTKAYPMNCFVQLRFEGCFERISLEAALRETLVFHPLLHSFVCVTKNNRFRWSPILAEPRIRWLNAWSLNQPLPSEGTFDLYHEPGIRLYIIEHSPFQNDLVLELHHSCSDAMGVFSFLEDLLEAYHLQIGGSVSESVKRLHPQERIDSSRLPFRGSYGLTPLTFLLGLHKHVWGLLRAWHFLVDRPIPLIPYEPETKADGPNAIYPATVSYVFAPGETATLRGVAKEQRVSLNDVLLAALYQAVQHWRDELDIARSDQPIRIAIPTNLRTAADQSFSAVNLVSMVFLDRKRSALSDKRRLLQSIHREMSHIKYCNLGLAFIFGLTVFKRCFGGFRRMIAQKRCWASTVLSNLGTPFTDTRLPVREGKITLGKDTITPLVLNEIYATSPIRPWTAVAIGVTTYADALSILLHYDAGCVSKTQAASLLEHFIRETRG